MNLIFRDIEPVDAKTAARLTDDWETAGGPTVDRIAQEIEVFAEAQGLSVEAATAYLFSVVADHHDMPYSEIED